VFHFFGQFLENSRSAQNLGQLFWLGYILGNFFGWATFWATFSQTQLVTLLLRQGKFIMLLPSAARPGRLLIKIL
jgi:hypothetical protein